MAEASGTGRAACCLSHSSCKYGQRSPLGHVPVAKSRQPIRDFGAPLELPASLFAPAPLCCAAPPGVDPRSNAVSAPSPASVLCGPVSAMPLSTAHSYGRLHQRPRRGGITPRYESRLATALWLFHVQDRGKKAFAVGAPFLGQAGCPSPYTGHPDDGETAALHRGSSVLAQNWMVHVAMHTGTRVHAVVRCPVRHAVAGAQTVIRPVRSVAGRAT